MQYSTFEKYKTFIVRYRRVIVFFLCALMIVVLMYCFNDGYSARLQNEEFSEIQNFIDEIFDRDKEIYNNLVVDLVRKDVKGIDVSEWQGDIDWEKVKNSGIDFVMIRCGFRNLSNEEMAEDTKFRYNISEANRLGIPVGVYFYSTAINEKEALEEATFVLNLVKDYDVTYPIAYDFELFDQKRTTGVSDKVINDNAIHFLDYIRSHGYHGMLYSNLRAINTHWNLDMFQGYSLWYAQYIDISTYDGDYVMWQYADNGRIDGIVGNVDLNEGYYAYEVITED